MKISTKLEKKKGSRSLNTERDHVKMEAEIGVMAIVKERGFFPPGPV